MNKDNTRITDWGNSKVVVIPSTVFKDSTFPFKLKDYAKLVIEIVKGKLVITKQGGNQK